MLPGASGHNSLASGVAHLLSDQKDLTILSEDPNISPKCIWRKLPIVDETDDREHAVKLLRDMNIDVAGSSIFFAVDRETSFLPDPEDRERYPTTLGAIEERIDIMEEARGKSIPVLLIADRDQVESAAAVANELVTSEEKATLTDLVKLKNEGRPVEGQIKVIDSTDEIIKHIIELGHEKILLHTPPRDIEKKNGLLVRKCESYNTEYRSKLSVLNLSQAEGESDCVHLLYGLDEFLPLKDGTHSFNRENSIVVTATEAEATTARSLGYSAVAIDTVVAKAILRELQH